jgi:hypothetical protein
MLHLWISVAIINVGGGLEPNEVREMLLNQRSSFLLAHARFQMFAITAIFVLGLALIACAALHSDGTQFPVLLNCGVECLSKSIAFSQDLMQSVDVMSLEDV